MFISILASNENNSSIHNSNSEENVNENISELSEPTLSELINAANEFFNETNENENNNENQNNILDTILYEYYISPYIRIVEENNNKISSEKIYYINHNSVKCLFDASKQLARLLINNISFQIPLNSLENTITNENNKFVYCNIENNIFEINLYLDTQNETNELMRFYLNINENNIPEIIIYNDNLHMKIKNIDILFF